MCIGKTGMKNLVLAGGVALNCVGNGRILREGPFEQIWIQPAAGDAGGALGRRCSSGINCWTSRENPRRRISSKARLLGPRFSDERDPRHRLIAHAAPSTRTCDRTTGTVRAVADLIAQEKVVGWFQGRMEFGPRALGARSILGDARSAKMQSVMNLKIKFRESFRPFAPIVLREHARSLLPDAAARGEPLHAARRPGGRTIRNRASTRQDRRVGIEKLHASDRAFRRSRTSTIRPACRRSTSSGTVCCISC